MQGRGMEVRFEYFYLPISRLAAIHPGVENRRQRFAQLDSGCKHSQAIMGAAVRPSLRACSAGSRRNCTAKRSRSA